MAFESKLLAYALSTVIFAMIHISGYIGIYDAKLLFCCFLQYIPAGLCLAWAYARADSIFAPILMHMAINVIGNATSIAGACFDDSDIGRITNRNKSATYLTLISLFIFR